MIVVLRAVGPCMLGDYPSPVALFGTNDDSGDEMDGPDLLGDQYRERMFCIWMTHAASSFQPLICTLATEVEVLSGPGASRMSLGISGNCTSSSSQTHAFEG